MNKHLYISSALAGILSVSTAGAVTAPSKTGFIFALNAGYNFFTANEVVTVSNHPVNSLNGPNKGKIAANGFLATGTCGYDFHIDGFSIGPELELAYTNASDTAIGNSLQGARKLTAKESFGVYVRFGAYIGRAMLYLKTGIKNQNIQYKAASELRPLATHKEQKRNSGYSIGAGSEVHLNMKTGIRFEYLFTKFRKMSFNLKSSNPAVSERVAYSIDPFSNTITMGIFIKI